MVKFERVSAERLVQAVQGTILHGSLEGVSVDHVGEPLEVDADGLAFVIAEAFVRDVAKTKAAVLVIQESLFEKVRDQLPQSVRVCIGCKDAYLGLAHVSKLLTDADPYQDWPLTQVTDVRIHPSAKVDATAKIASGAVICEDAIIGPRVTILAGAVVGPQAEVGADTVLFPGVVLYPRTKIGQRVRLHANVVIGADGFGYARGPRGSVKIWHLGRVVLGDDVEVGAGTTIDRGTLKDTVVEQGAKIDNQVQIGHNGWVKAHAILCAQVGLAGNVTVGTGAILAGKAGVADKVEVGDGAIVGPMSGLSKDIKPREVVMGQQPPKPRREWWKLIALFERLPELFDRVKKLENNGKQL